MLPRITATRYVTPLKEGGSLPGIVEADDCGTYVVKFRGAGQGLKVLVAEVIVARLAGLIGVPVPALAVVDLDARLAQYEADEEVQDLLRASIGSNLGVDFLPGALGYDGSTRPSTDLAERIIWLDALTANVDRTWSNPNLLVWHGRVHAIDHGAALYAHHTWPDRPPDPDRFAGQRFDATPHVLADVALDVAARHPELSALLPPEAFAAAIDEVPDEWLEHTPWLPDPAAVRAAYRALLLARIGRPDAWLPRSVSS